MINRTRFRVVSVTASPTVVNVKGDTGILQGEVKQIKWTPDAADTGTPATVQLAIIPDTADTGQGWIFWTATNQMGVGWDTGAPKMAQGFGAGEKLRLKVRPTDTGNVIRGNLWVWTENNP